MKMICGNWKMNKSRSEVVSYFDTFKALLGSQDQALIAVPYVYLEEARRICSGTSIIIAAQNVHQQTSGAFTGEVSLAMLKDIGIDWTLIGHSERRQYFNETNEAVALKLEACVSAGVHAIVCIGETLGQREAGKTFAVLSEQLAPLYASLGRCPRVVVAYEPVWAIGTGKTATTEQAQEVHAWIRTQLKEKGILTSTLLYGGSVTPQNSGALLSQPDIDGALVGGASLKPADFFEIVRCAR